MKCQLGLPFYLLLWTLTVLVSCDSSPEIKVDELSDGIKVACPDGYEINNNQSIILLYNADNSGEYTCTKGDSSVKIFVKLRPCDNCVELDLGSIVGLVIGDVVATAVIGVGVYLIASHASQSGSATSIKKNKSSDRHQLVSETRGPTSDHYQALNPRGQKDTYEKLVHRK